MAGGKWADIDREMLKKYDKAGPRYTSYPTAPNFKDGFSEEDLKTLLAASAAEAEPADLSFYVHIPFCKTQCLYCGCNSTPCSDRPVIADYLDALHLEIARVGALLTPGRRAAELHFGGGTPSLLTLEDVEKILTALARFAPWTDDAELSMELDPRTVEPGYLAGLRGLGFTRVSFGVQDFNTQVQEAIGRVQPEATTMRVVAEARAAGFGRVNLDLIYGLPYQTRTSYAETVDRLLALDPDRVALFNFAYVPHMKPFQSQMPIDKLPALDEKLSIFLETVDRFEAGGYRFIGLDHFSKPEDELSQAFDAKRLHRSFQGYTARHGLEVLAFGASGISQLRHGFAQNLRDPDAYRAKLAAGESPIIRGLQLQGEDRLRQAVIESIFCNESVDTAAIEERFDIDFDSTFAGWREALAPMAADGFVQLDETGLKVERLGRLVMRNVAMVFDAYWSPEDGDGGRYSRTI